MPNTLGLDDDLDEVELIQGLEQAFGFRLRPEETTNLYTVGDIFALLQRRLSAAGDAAQGCASAMAFYRLRRALAQPGAAKAAPASLLSDLSAASPKSVFGAIRERTGFRLPGLRYSPLGHVGVALACLILLAPVAAGIGAGRWTMLPIALAAIGFTLMRLDGRRFPADCHTLSDLARKVAGLNFGLLRTEGAGRREKDVWSALLEVLSDHAFLRKSEIARETLLLERQLRAR
jgi:hypothetical protein